VQFLNLDEYGTNYPKERFDPHEWSEESYYDNLGKTLDIEVVVYATL